MRDLNTLLARFPAAKEREAALQQKAFLATGKCEGNVGRVPAIAEGISEKLGGVPGNYHIGEAAFEAKDYKESWRPWRRRVS